jgi:hypothetical protein
MGNIYKERFINNNMKKQFTCPCCNLKIIKNNKNTIYDVKNMESKTYFKFMKKLMNDYHK